MVIRLFDQGYPIKEDIDQGDQSPDLPLQRDTGKIMG